MKNESQICHAATDCEESAYCQGNNASCPEPKPKEDNKVCNEGTKVRMTGSHFTLLAHDALSFYINFLLCDTIVILKVITTITYKKDCFGYFSSQPFNPAALIPLMFGS